VTLVRSAVYKSSYLLTKRLTIVHITNLCMYVCNGNTFHTSDTQLNCYQVKKNTVLSVRKTEERLISTYSVLNREVFVTLTSSSLMVIS